MDGEGTYYWTDGSYYEGNWVEGMQHGEGTLHHNNGIIESGIWDKNLLIAPKNFQKSDKE